MHRATRTHCNSLSGSTLLPVGSLCIQRHQLLPAIQSAGSARHQYLTLPHPQSMLQPIPLASSLPVIATQHEHDTLPPSHPIQPHPPAPLQRLVLSTVPASSQLRPAPRRAAMISWYSAGGGDYLVYSPVAIVRYLYWATTQHQRTFDSQPPQRASCSSVCGPSAASATASTLPSPSSPTTSP